MYVYIYFLNWFRRFGYDVYAPTDNFPSHSLLFRSPPSCLTPFPFRLHALPALPQLLGSLDSAVSSSAGPGGDRPIFDTF